MPAFTASRTLILIALVLAILAAVHVVPWPVDLFPLSFAVFLGACLLGPSERVV
jgi:Na+/citrate or Na+/malate symporter